MERRALTQPITMHHQVKSCFLISNVHEALQKDMSSRMASRLQVLKAIIEYQDGNSLQQPVQEELLSWPKAIGSNTSSDSKSSVEALSRLNDTWGWKSKRGGAAKIMPFIAGLDFQATVKS